MTTQDFVTHLLAHMGVEDVTVDIVADGEAQTINLTINEQDSGLLIGRHAESIDSLQRIIRLVCQKDGDKPIHVNINDFRERREERVRELARHVAQRALESGYPQMLRLPANERRIVHMELADMSEVEAVSEGEGMNRVLYIKPTQVSQ